MINSQDFIKRLQIIIDHYQLSAASLADKIAVQRSSISHLLSGRNKPSLEFVLKLVRQFPEVNLYWLLNGTGNFPSTLSEFNIPKEIISEGNKESERLSDEKTTEISKTLKEQMLHSNHYYTQDEIDTVIICYKNGNFKSYKNLD
jgi:transcriptional regulator with XRE-family HTH domain